MVGIISIANGAGLTSVNIYNVSRSWRLSICFAMAADLERCRRLRRIISAHAISGRFMGFGSAVGSPLIATIRERTVHYTDAPYIIAGAMLVSAVIPLVYPPAEQRGQSFATSQPHPTH